MKYSDPLCPEKYYHIYNHAVGVENLFREEANYLYFLKKYAVSIFPYCKTYAYCLMPNHFHFLISVREENEILKAYKTLNKSQINIDNSLDPSKIVMQQFSNLFNGYSKAFNKKYNRMGALFVDYLKRIEVTEDIYFTRIINYIHLNPLHHGFVRNLLDWPFSSYHAIISDKPSRIEKENVINWFGNLREFEDFHKINFSMLYSAKELANLEFV